MAVKQFLDVNYDAGQFMDVNFCNWNAATEFSVFLKRSSSSGAKLLCSRWMQVHPLKFQKSIIMFNFSPYMHHPHLILMHPQGRCTPFMFALASPLELMLASWCAGPGVQLASWCSPNTWTALGCRNLTAGTRCLDGVQGAKWKSPCVGKDGVWRLEHKIIGYRWIEDPWPRFNMCILAPKLFEHRISCCKKNKGSIVFDNDDRM